MNPAATILLCLVLLPASTDKEHQLRFTYDDVAADARALIATVESMEASLHQHGMELHPEIAAARNHLATTMNRASEALSRRDWKELRKCLDRARGWMEQLRRKL